MQVTAGPRTRHLFMVTDLFSWLLTTLLTYYHIFSSLFTSLDRFLFLS